jgi:hypothetical protein
VTPQLPSTMLLRPPRTERVWTAEALTEGEVIVNAEAIEEVAETISAVTRRAATSGERSSMIGLIGRVFVFVRGVFVLDFFLMMVLVVVVVMMVVDDVDV